MMDKNLTINIILNLMRAKNVKQKDICELLDITQPQLSKLLSLKTDRFFSVEQLLLLADYFGVSIDYLLGRSTEAEAASTSSKSICQLILRLLLLDKISFDKVIRREKVYEECDPADNGGLPYGCIQRDNEYIMFYFPKFEDVEKFVKDGDETYLLTHGNQNAEGVKINDFLSKLIKYKDLLDNEVMEKRIFDEAMKGLLDNV